MSRYDAAIVGSGFAGAILARLLRRQGRRVLLVERGRHPRFALGESSTPLAACALERLAARHDLPDLHHLSTWGRWRRHLPRLRRGLKRGFTFFRHRRGEPYRNSPANEARLLVAASPSDAIADVHWLRADVDAHLVERAVAEGIDYRDETTVDGVDFGDAGAVLHTRGGDRFHASYVVDATGPAGLLANVLPIPRQEVPIASSLLYAHFESPPPFVEIARRGGAAMDPGPYPDERAAVHHLLDGAWLYALPFDHGVTSAGLVTLARASGPVEDPAAAWREALAPYPTLAEQFADAHPLAPVRFVERLQHRLERAAGERWFVLPHAFAFYDPMFSTGIAWSLLAVERLALLFEGVAGDAWRYDYLLRHEADRIAQLVEAAYLALGDFELFTAVAHLYFVTVSWAEARQRLLTETAPHAWEGFLGVGDPHLDALFDDVLAALRARHSELFDRAAWRRRLREGLAPRNVAGLDDPARRNLYPVDLDVLVGRAALLGLEREEIVAALPRLRGNPPS